MIYESCEAEKKERRGKTNIITAVINGEINFWSFNCSFILFLTTIDEEKKRARISLKFNESAYVAD
jgi:hypothetical protein